MCSSFYKKLIFLFLHTTAGFFLLARMAPLPHHQQRDGPPLNERFALDANILTEAVLVVDDDILWAPAPGFPHFSQLFHYWNAHPEHRNRLIGFARRGTARRDPPPSSLLSAIAGVVVFKRFSKMFKVFVRGGKGSFQGFQPCLKTVFIIV